MDDIILWASMSKGGVGYWPSSFWQVLSDWPLGTIVGILVIIVVLLILLVIIAGLCALIDSSFLTLKKGFGKVISKKFIPAFDTTERILSTVTDTYQERLIHYPNNWVILLNIEGQTSNIPISENLFNSITVGDTIEIKYAFTRLSHELVIKFRYN